MKTSLHYIELKTGHDGKGPAWIGRVEFSKTGQTVYFNGKAYKRLKHGGILGNFYDIETNDEYWISGIKKNGQDRHWAGSGKVMIDKTIIDEYLKIVNFKILDKQHFEPVDIRPTDKQKFLRLENKKTGSEHVQKPEHTHERTGVFNAMPNTV